MARKNRVQPGTPDAVIKAAKTADELHKQVYGDKQDDTKELAAGEAPGDTGGDDKGIQSAQPQTQPDVAGDTSATPNGEGEKPLNGDAPPSATPVEPQQQPQQQADSDTQKKPDDWEKRYLSLKGKYDVEVPRLAGELRELKQQLQQMQQAQTVAEPPAAKADPKKDVVTEEDLADYGEDLVAFIRRVAEHAASTAVSNLTPKLEQLQGQVVQSVQRQATSTVYSKLDKEVQDWRDINKSPEFIGWLAERDAFAGEYRKNLLARAFDDGDADRVVAFFKGFLAERQAVAPTPTAQDVPAQSQPAQPEPGQPQVSLEQLAGPAGGPSVAEVNTQPQQAQIWSRDQIAKFYREVANGAYRNKPDERARIEASIAAAMAENRIA